MNLIPHTNIQKKYFQKWTNIFIQSMLKNEIDKVFERKNEEFERFFRRIARYLKKLKNDHFISNCKIHDIINRFDKIGELDLDDMHYAFDAIWKSFRFGENQENGQIILELNEFINEFCSKHGNRKDDIEKIINEIPNHTYKDKDVLNMR